MTGPGARATALVAALLVATPAGALADPARIRAARRAIDEEVRYDRAQALLVAALHAGDNGPDELAAIYELAGVAAVVLGDRASGQRYFERLLALRPRARLPADSAPKLIEPFTAAQARMAAAGPLRVAVRAEPGRLIVELPSDPLAMVAGVRVRVRDAGGAREQRVTGPAPFRIVVPAGARAERVLVVDEHGNRLVERPAPAAPVTAAGLAERAPERSRPRWRRASTWAVPALAATAIGVGFGLDARAQDQRLAEILADPAAYTFDDAEAVRRRWRRDVIVADAAFATGGVLALTALAVWVLDRPGPAGGVALRPLAVPGGGGVVVAW